MDYTSKPFIFKLKKAARYVKLYGLRRTLVKIEGQYHMKRRYAELPAMQTNTNETAHVGIIGCGNYAFSHIAYYLRRNFGRVIRGVGDIDVNRAASFFEKYNAVYYTDRCERVISDPEIDLVFIASNHASHAEYAVQALAHGKAVHIEKPHVVSEEQLERLCSAMGEFRGRVNLGFNRPKSPFGVMIKSALDSQSGAAVYNWFVAGHEIPSDHWYYKPEEGGRVLGNLCHWTDFVYQLVPASRRYPLVIHPTRSEMSDCDIAVTYRFGDGTIAAITFSAKGHTFEGVRERFAAHRGNVLVALDDYKRLVIENVDRKSTYSSAQRNHGHERNILDSYLLLSKPSSGFTGCPVEYVWETGDLFLKTKQALEQNKPLVLNGYRPHAADTKLAAAGMV